MTEAAQIESAAISREEADIIRALMEEFYVKKALSEAERRVFLSICSRFDFGRPVTGI